MDYLNIGSTPAAEPCAQLGEADYEVKARKECTRFLAQIQRHYPEPMRGALRVKAFPHDFGIYYEVVAWFDPDDEEATEWALSIEGDDKGVLQEWDDMPVQLDLNLQ